MYCTYLGRNHDPDECHYCPLGSPCQGIPSRLIINAQSVGSGGSNTASKSESLNNGKVYPVWRAGGQAVNPRLSQRVSGKEAR